MTTQNGLVTGGAGYVGSHTAKMLASGGFTPVTYDNLTLGRAEAVRWGPLVHGDIRDSSAMAEAIRAPKTTAVSHFAALSSVGESGLEPRNHHRKNVGGLLGLLDGMAETGCDTIVVSSTAAVYDEAGDEPIPEDAPARPVHIYGRTILMCETILADHAAAHGLKAISLRYLNASGADAGYPYSN